MKPRWLSSGPDLDQDPDQDPDRLPPDNRNPNIPVVLPLEPEAWPTAGWACPERHLDQRPIKRGIRPGDTQPTVCYLTTGEPTT